MDYYLSRIQSTTSSISAFKREQERLILSTHNTHGSLALANGTNLSSFQDSTSEAVLNKILNTDCILMPYCTTHNSHQKLWPQALVANRMNGSAEIGLIESYGSMWKMIPLSESGNGSIVILQCSERGDISRYLGPDLEIVEMKVDAAAWRVRVCDYVESNTQALADTPADGNLLRGVVVVFELVSSTAPNAGAGKVGVGAGTAQLLVCETSIELRNYSELFIEPVNLPDGAAGMGQDKPIVISEQESTEQHGAGDEEGGHPTYRSIRWEVVPEAWLLQDSTIEDSGLDFLEGYIN